MMRYEHKNNLHTLTSKISTDTGSEYGMVLPSFSYFRFDAGMTPPVYTIHSNCVDTQALNLSRNSMKHDQVVKIDMSSSIPGLVLTR